MTVQLFVFLWLGTAFCRPEGATGEVFEPVKEGGITRGPSDGFGTAERIGQDLVLVRRDERGKVRIARTDWACVGHLVVADEPQLCLHARPWPFRRLINKTRPHRVQNNGASRPRQDGLHPWPRSQTGPARIGLSASGGHEHARHRRDALSPERALCHPCPEV